MKNNSKDFKIDDQKQRIAEILQGIHTKNKAEEKWEEYLTNNLLFPFEEKIVNPDEDADELKYGDIVSVKKVEASFDLYGIVAEVRKARRKYYISLCQLEVMDTYSHNYIKVEDYNAWFANR